MLKGTKRTFQRIKNKTGLGHETVDTQFDAHHERYKQSAALLEKIKDHMAKIVEAHRTLNVAAMEMSKTLSKFVRGDAQHRAAFDAHKSALIAIDERWRDMDAVVVAEAMLPTAKFTGEFLVIHERIDLRNVRRVDMDRYQAGLSGKSKKDKATYDRALQKAESSKAAFHALNDELKDDIPKLCNYLGKFYDYSFDTFIRQQSLYLKESLLALRPARDALSGVDPRLCKNYQRVITSASISAASTGSVQSHKLTDYDVDEVKKQRASDNRKSRSAAEAAAAATPAAESDAPKPEARSAPAPAARAAPAPAARGAMAGRGAPARRGGPAGRGAPAGRGGPAGRGAPTPVSRGAPAAAVSPTNPFAAEVAQKPAAAAAVAAAATAAVSKKDQVIGLWDFAGEEDDELPFKKGDLLTIIDRSDDDWWEAKDKNGRTGSIPSNYTKAL